MNAAVNRSGRVDANWMMRVNSKGWISMRKQLLVLDSILFSYLILLDQKVGYVLTRILEIEHLRTKL